MPGTYEEHFLGTIPILLISAGFCIGWAYLGFLFPPTDSTGFLLYIIGGLALEMIILWWLPTFPFKRILLDKKEGDLN